MIKRELLKGEEILKKTRPHPFAFSNLYVIWAYLIIVGLTFILLINELEETTFSIPLFMDSFISIETSPWIYYFFLALLILIPGIKCRPLSIYGGYVFGLYLISRLLKEPLQHSLTSVPVLSETPVLLETILSKIAIFSEIPILSETSPLSDITISFVPDQKFFLTVWLLMIIIPGIIIALTQINWKWFALFIAIIVFIMVLKIEFGLDFNQVNLFLISFGIIGALGTEFWRRRHRYYITNLRIVTECMGKRREVFYDRILDLILERSILGWIFKFGSITPLTGSGIGTGMDISLIGAGVGKSVKEKLLGVMFGGGKTISTPRARSPYILYGIPNPKREYKRITGLMLGLTEENGTNEIEELESIKGIRWGLLKKLFNRILHKNTTNSSTA